MRVNPRRRWLRLGASGGQGSAMMVSWLVSSCRILVGPLRSSTRWVAPVLIRTFAFWVPVRVWVGSRGERARRTASRRPRARSSGGGATFLTGSLGIPRAASAPLVRYSRTDAGKLRGAGWETAPSLFPSDAGATLDGTIEKIGDRLFGSTERCPDLSFEVTSPLQCRWGFPRQAEQASFVRRTLDVRFTALRPCWLCVGAWLPPTRLLPRWHGRPAPT